MLQKKQSMEIYFCLIIACILQSSIQTERDGGKDIYKAAVVEYSPSPITNFNKWQYILFIMSAKESSCDIIVFPEATLTVRKKGSLLPNPEDKIVPYKNETYKSYEVVRTISEAAATHRIYVVVNLYERVNCSDAASDCPERGYFLYNTNVAFDRNGTVVARYRKFNLYDEEGVNKPKDAELSTFTTDFGVTFGIFICFDILFKAPTIDLIQKKNVTNLIFSSFWFGELPFLTAAQMQTGWSYSMDVNLLASGANEPIIGSTGSGIYSGRKYKKSYMLERVSSMMIVGEPNGESGRKLIEPSENGNFTECSGLILKQDPSIPDSRGKDLDLDAGSFEDELCHNGLCCRFSAKYRKSREGDSGNYGYRAVAFQGERFFGKTTKREAAYCAIILCTDGNCAKKPPNGDYPLIFEEIKVDAEFPEKNTFQMPNTLIWSREMKGKMLLRTMDYDSFAYERNGIDGTDTANVSIVLKKGNVSNLLTFGIFGRKFE